MLDLIEILFSRHGIRSLRFDGKMDRQQRDTVLATFKKAGGPKVILIRSVNIVV
jgi:SNF2 family DNA or RNA helicase